MNGHIGAVYGIDGPGKKRPKTIWKVRGSQDPVLKVGFDTTINTSLQLSTSIGAYITAICHLYEQKILHEKTPVINLIASPYYLANGAATNNYEQVVSFMWNNLQEPHEMMQIWLRDIFIQVKINELTNYETLVVTYQDELILPVNVGKLAASTVALPFAISQIPAFRS